MGSTNYILLCGNLIIINYSDKCGPDDRCDYVNVDRVGDHF